MEKLYEHKPTGKTPAETVNVVSLNTQSDPKAVQANEARFCCGLDLRPLRAIWIVGVDGKPELW